MHKVLIPLAILILPSALSFAPAASGEALPRPQIEDPAHDVSVSAPGFLVGVSTPGVDVLSVTIWREEDQVVFSTAVVDWDFRPAASTRTYAIYWLSDQYERVEIILSQDWDGTWHSKLYCMNGLQTVCNVFLPAPTVDPDASTITISAPLVRVGKVIAPRITAGEDFGQAWMMPVWNVGIYDFAPNDGPGRDFDPYA